MNKYRYSDRARAAQTFIEYATLAALTAVVLVVMGNYFSRSLQGKLKEAVDPIGEEYHRSVAMPESGYRVSSVFERFSTGKGVVASSSSVHKGTFTYTYEGERGFAVSHRSSSRNESASMYGTVYPTSADGKLEERWKDGVPAGFEEEGERLQKAYEEELKKRNKDPEQVVEEGLKEDEEAERRQRARDEDKE